MINGVEKKKTQHNFVFIVLNFSLTFVFFFCEISDNYISLRSQTGMLPLFLNRECFSCFIPSSDFQLSSFRSSWKGFHHRGHNYLCFLPIPELIMRFFSVHCLVLACPPFSQDS